MPALDFKSFGSNLIPSSEIKDISYIITVAK